MKIVSASSEIDTPSSILNLKDFLLSIYDKVIVTDMNGIIIKTYGSIEGLWAMKEDQFSGEDIKKIEVDTFLSDSSMQLVLDKKSKISHIQTSWNNKKILVTGLPIMSNDYQIDRVVLAYQNLTTEIKSYNISNLEKKNDLKIPNSIVIHGEKMQEIIGTLQMASKVSTTILLLGDSGVGKERIAQSIHQMGNRHDQPFIAVNCGAIPESLIDSELFGYEGGAFSGAKKEGSVGKFTLANNGILFLDEIAELPLQQQVRLLRVLQEKEITPLGSSKTQKINIQVIAATNKSLEDLVAKGEFRKDLYYRLNVIPINIPSLKERVEEIPYLTHHFIEKYNRLHEKYISFSPDAIDLLSIYDWPGNIRELENLIERIIVTNEISEIDASIVQLLIPWNKETIDTLPMINHLMPLQEAVDLVEEQLITMAMERYKSVKVAAKVLDISQPTMSRKYKRIREKLEDSIKSPSNNRRVMEAELDKRLRAIAIASAAIIRPDEVSQLQQDLSPSNPVYQSLQKKLTLIREQEGAIEWAFLFEIINHKHAINLVADKNFVMKPGEAYLGPPEIMDVAIAASKGKIGVTPIYQDPYGSWKTSFAPIFNEIGQVIAIIGYDYSESYINTELQKLKRLLNIKF